MSVKRLEKIYPIEVIASIIENKLLYEHDSYYSINKFVEDITDFCSFITGEDVKYSDIYRFIPVIKNELINQYPDLNRPVNLKDDFEILNDYQIKSILRRYRIIFGSFILIKSLKKGIVKTLEVQDK